MWSILIVGIQTVVLTADFFFGFKEVQSILRYFWLFYESVMHMADSIGPRALYNLTMQ